MADMRTSGVSQRILDYLDIVLKKGKAKGEMQTWDEAVTSLANSMLNTVNKLKRDYKAWPETSALKDLKSKCLSLGRIFEDSTIPYKGKE